MAILSVKFWFHDLRALLKTSRAQQRRGAKGRKSAVYTPVHEHFEVFCNEIFASAVVFRGTLLSRGSILSLELLACFAKTALPLGIAGQGAFESLGVKVGPEGVGEIQFGIGRLPEQKIADT